MDCHELLGLPPTASLDDAEAAYHRLIRIHHPDFHQSGSKHELAAAEARTRALNGAIAQIRALTEAAKVAQSLRRRVADGSSTFEQRHPGPDRAASASTWARASADPAAAGSTAGVSGSAYGWGTGGPTHTGPAWARAAEPRYSSRGYYGERQLTVPCPFCGTQFSEALALKSHVAALHAVHLDRRVRTRRPSRLRAWFHTIFASLWLLLPINLGMALIIGAVVNNVVHQPQFSYWVVALAMAPTVIRLLDGGFTDSA